MRDVQGLRTMGGEGYLGKIREGLFRGGSWKVRRYSGSRDNRRGGRGML